MCVCPTTAILYNMAREQSQAQHSSQYVIPSLEEIEYENNVSHCAVSLLFSLLSSIAPESDMFFGV